MTLQPAVMPQIILSLGLPVTLLCGSTVHWFNTRRISSIGMIVGAGLVLIVAIISAMYHPISPLGRQLSTQQYGSRLNI